MLLSESVDKVIDLARQVRAYYDRELPRYHPDYPLVRPEDREPPAPPVERELAEYLESLPAETVYALLTLVDLAWGAFGVEDMEAHFDEMRHSYEGPEPVVANLMGNVPLGDQLADAREELLTRGINLDGLFQVTRPIA